MKRGIVIAAIVGVVALVWFGRSMVSLGGSGTEGLEGVPVRRGPLRIDVVERGNLAAAKSVSLKSEVEGTTTILFLIEEGTAVGPGDLLCELDTSGLIEERVQQEIAVQNADAAYVKAKQNYEIQKSQNETDIARAERELEFAKIDLEKYVEGDLPQQRKQKEEDIKLAEEELVRAQQDLEWSERLAKQGFLESTQLDADRLKMTRADIQLKQRIRALELLDKYEGPRTRQEYEADVIEKERELARANLQAEARIVDYTADMRTSKARLDLQTEKLAKLDAQIGKARITAPVAGMVVYARERSRWSNEPVQEGAPIRERQEIITIPSSDGMIVEASLHESVLERVKEGMSCSVTVDAVPDRVYRGTVKYKAVLPDQNSWWANPDLRVYRTEIQLSDVDDRLRPGMSCSIEILVDQLEDVLYVPQQAIFLDGGETVCFVSEADGVDIRAVEAGQSNERWVEVVDGLEEGELVLMSQPPGYELAPAPSGFGGGEDEEPGGDRPSWPGMGGGGDMRADVGARAGGPGASGGSRGPGGAGAPGRDGSRGEGGRPGGGAEAGSAPAAASHGQRPGDAGTRRDGEGRQSGGARPAAAGEATKQAP